MDINNKLENYFLNISTFALSSNCRYDATEDIQTVYEVTVCESIVKDLFGPKHSLIQQRTAFLIVIHSPVYH